MGSGQVEFVLFGRVVWTWRFSERFSERFSGPTHQLDLIQWKKSNTVEMSLTNGLY
jgi:hypothetical protein